MSLVNEKDLKDKINEALSNSSDEATDNVDPAEDSTSFPSQDAVDRHLLDDIIGKYEEVLSMKKTSKKNSEDIERQFKNLREKLDSNSEYLDELKRNVGNMNFSQHNKALDLYNMEPGACLENDFTYTRERINEKMDDIRKKIDNLRSKMADQKEKQQHVYDDYKKAFQTVIDNFQDIESGSYSSEISNSRSE